MTRVVFVNRYFYPDHSATAQLLADLAFALAGDGAAVTVVTSRQRYDQPGVRLPARKEVQGVHIRRVWTSRFGRARLLGRLLDYLTFYPSAFAAILKESRRGDVIVAMTDPPLISVVAAMAAWLRGAVLINWLQDLFPEVARALGVVGDGPHYRLLRALRNGSLRRARMNIAIGERMAERVRGEGIPADRVQVIHNWADPGIRPVAPEDNPLRTAWGLQGKTVVGYSGNMGRAHEFGTLLDAAAALRDDPRFVFLFIGDGAKRPWLEAQVAERGLGNVLFKPYQPRESLAFSLSVPDIHVVSLLPELEGLIVPSKIYGILAAQRPVLFIGDPDGEVGRMAGAATLGANDRRRQELLAFLEVAVSHRDATAAARRPEARDTDFPWGGLQMLATVLRQQHLDGSCHLQAS